MDDMNNMNESVDTVDRPGGVIGNALGAGVDRRTMLKAAVAAGTIAGTWVAPRIETLGFAPAAAAGTPCDVLSPESDDKNQNSGKNDCPGSNKNPPDPPCCGRSFGNAGNTPDEFTFLNPITGCTKLVVRIIGLDCDPNKFDPDISQFAVVIDNSQSMGPTCVNCTVKEAVIIDPSMGRTEVATIVGTPFECDGFGSGRNVSLPPCPPPPTIDPSFRLAVRITCVVVIGECQPPPASTSVKVKLGNNSVDVGVGVTP